MSCQICGFVVGGNYLTHGVCEECETSREGMIGTYLGKKNGIHIFRLHPKYVCGGCGEERNYCQVQCDNEPMNVTQEFQSLFVGDKVARR